MTTINWQVDPNFNEDLYQFLLNTELDGKSGWTLSQVNGDLTIGVGMDLNTGGLPIQNAVFIAMGFDPQVVNGTAPNSGAAAQEYQLVQQIRSAIAAKNQALIQSLMKNNALGLPTSFAFATNAQMKEAFGLAWTNYYLPRIKADFPSLSQDTNFLNSRELIALGDMVWNDPGLIGRDLKNAINDGDRAEAWYQIRYRSNLTSLPGVAKRRDYEAQQFGLYATPNDPTLSESVMTYQMLTEHRAHILAYENQFGGEINAANNNYNLWNTADQVQTLQQALQPAETVLMGAVQNEYGNWLTSIPGPTNDEGIYLNPGRDISLNPVDPNYGWTADTHLSTSNDLLIASAGSEVGNLLAPDQGNDSLVAGSGSDTLIAGAGQDTLVAGSGSDTLIGGLGNDTIYAGTGQDTFDYVASGSFTETIINSSIASAQDAIYAGSLTPTQLTGGKAAGSDTWKSSDGTTYTFVTHLGPMSNDTGTLFIAGGGLGSGEIVIQNFNMTTAETTTYGDLGLKFSQQVAVGSGTSFNPLRGNNKPVNADSAVSAGALDFKVYLSSVGTKPTDVTLSFSGGDLSGFDIWNNGTWESIASGTATVTVPAGSSSMTLVLRANKELTTQESVTVKAAIVGGDTSAPTNTFTASFTASPQATTQTPTLEAITQPYTVIGGVNYYQGNGGNDSIVGTGGGTSYINASNSVNDYLAGADTIYGGTGNDTIVGSGYDYINASQSLNDSITGSAGNDTIIGGNGNDTIIGNGGSDILVAGNGNDKIYADSKESLGQAIQTAATAVASGDPGSLLAVGNGNSTVVGGTGNDQFLVGDGNNAVVMGPGNDTLFSGVTLSQTPTAGQGWFDNLSVTETLTYASGSVQPSTSIQGFMSFAMQSTGYIASSTYYGNYDTYGAPVGVGNDTIYAGSGNDLINLSNGNNLVVNGSGSDTIIGGMGQNTIVGGAGNDVIWGLGGAVSVYGGSGNDIIQGGMGNNTIYGGTGNDLISAGSYGGGTPGNDLVYGGAGSDTINGAGGNDTLIGGTGNDTIYGNAGGIYTGNKYLYGGTGSDQLWANSYGNNTVVGGSGNDILIGGGANDTIYAGGNGNDTLYGSTSWSNTGTQYLYAGSGNDLLLGGDGSGQAVLHGGSGTDTLWGGYGNDTVYAGSGGTAADPTLAYGGAGNATVYGGAGTAELYATTFGESSLVGGSGNDTLYAGFGQDTLVAGSGNTTMMGYTGVTTYEFGVNGGNALIEQLSGVDTIEFGDGITASDLTVTAALGPQGQQDLVIGYAPNAAVTVMGGLTGAIASVDFLDPSVLSLDQLMAQATTYATDIAGPNGDLIFAGSAGSLLTGGAGNDTIYGWGTNDTLMGGAGNTQIYAEDARDILTGGAGNDTLNGFGANETMNGGSGNDTFVINHASDVITKQPNTGNNTVLSSVSYVQPENVQNLTLTGTANLTATGNNQTGVLTANSGNDTLMAGSGVDTLVGGYGHDTFIVDNTADVVSAQPNGNNTVLSSVSYIQPENVQNLTLTGTANLTATGNNQTGVLTANSGNDTLVAGSGIDTLVGGSGNDTFVINNINDTIVESPNTGDNTVLSSVSYVLPANIQNLTLTGTANVTGTGNTLNNVITGNGGNDTLIAGSGNDTLVAGSGIDTLVGGSGNDTFVINNSADTIMKGPNTGNSTVLSSVSYVLPANIQNLTLTGTANLTGTGNTLNNVITGNGGNDTLIAGSGNDTLVAGTGIDTLIGGSGNDTFVINNVNDTIEEAPNTGNNTVLSSVSYVLPANIQNLTLTGSADLTGTGNTLNNVITGNAGNDTLIAGSGNDTLVAGTGIDTLIGGSGNDTFVINNSADTIVQGAGSAAVFSSVSYVLPKGIDSLTLTGTGITGTANHGDDILTADGGNDTLYGGTGHDTLVAGSGNDLLAAGSGRTTLIGGSGNDTLMSGTGRATMIGGSGNDTMVSGSGRTTMIGGTGSDTFVINNAQDVILAPAGASGDRVLSSVNYVLPTHLTQLTLTGNKNLAATGNASNDLLIGNSGKDTLVGGSGVDVLEGGSGADLLVDQKGPGVLVAGSGNATLVGGRFATFFAAGAQTTTVTTGASDNVIASNGADGPMTVQASPGSQNTLSLGGGINEAALTFSKSGQNLVLQTGGTDTITFKGWYAHPASPSVVTLQIIEQSSASYNPESADPLVNRAVETFNFQQLVAQFNAARAADRALTHWSLMNGLLDTHLAGSDTAALGGDLAYVYGSRGHLTGMDLAAAQTTVQSPQFGATAQTLQPWNTISGSSPVLK
ncbi:MAG: hypothetical protein ACYDEV_01000 [Acidiferrobacter sp.]